MNIKRFTFWICLVAFISAMGCSSKPTPDPLAGWHAASKNPDQTIDSDYKNYIQTLSPEEKRSVGLTHFYEDGTGQHAIEIIIGINGRYWRHILIYDKDDKRIKTIKYATGYYAS